MIEVERHQGVHAGREAARRGREPVARVLIAGEDTGGQFAVVEVTVVPGGEPARHLHTREDELVYVLAGDLTYYVGEETHTATAGAAVFLPRGREHTFRVESAAARLVALLVPAGVEGLYGELAGAATGAGRDLERLVTVAARYGVEITGPPPGTDHDQRRTPHGTSH